jgi:hypothetical protein
MVNHQGGTPALLPRPAVGSAAHAADELPRPATGSSELAVSELCP